MLTDTSDDSDAYQYYMPYGNYVCSIDFNYSYSRNSIDWWTDEVKTRTGESYGRATMEYYYLEGEGWILDDMYIRY